MPNEYDAIIIGAGHNGLVTAGYRARAGLRVLVLEGRDVVGGACVTEEIFPRFKFSTTSYLCSLLQEKVRRDLELEKCGLTIYPKDSAFFSPFPDGTYLTMGSDTAATLRSMVFRISPACPARRWRRITRPRFTSAQRWSTSSAPTTIPNTAAPVRAPVHNAAREIQKDWKKLKRG